MFKLYLIFLVKNCRLSTCKQIALQMFGSNLRTKYLKPIICVICDDLHCRQYCLKFVKCLNQTVCIHVLNVQWVSSIERITNKYRLSDDFCYQGLEL